jgi:hypothetical protein
VSNHFPPCSIVISNPSNAQAGQARSDGIGQPADQRITRYRKYHTQRRDIQIEASVQLVHDSLLLMLHKRLRFARKSRSGVLTRSDPFVRPYSLCRYLKPNISSAVGVSSTVVVVKCVIVMNRYHKPLGPQRDQGLDMHGLLVYSSVMGTCQSSHPPQSGMWRGELICLPPPTSLELGHGYRGARTTDTVDISTPSAFPKVSTTSNFTTKGVRGLRVLTLVVRFHTSTPHPRVKQATETCKATSSQNEAGPYPLRSPMHQRICAWHATLCIITHLCGRFAILLAV